MNATEANSLPNGGGGNGNPMQGFNCKPDSPCVGVCVLDDQTQLCTGCLRTLAEISAWWAMSRRDRDEVLDQIAARRKLSEPERPNSNQD